MFFPPEREASLSRERGDDVASGGVGREEKTDGRKSAFFRFLRDNSVLLPEKTGKTMMRKTGLAAAVVLSLVLASCTATRATVGQGLPAPVRGAALFRAQADSLTYSQRDSMAVQWYAAGDFPRFMRHFQRVDTQIGYLGRTDGEGALLRGAGLSVRGHGRGFPPPSPYAPSGAAYCRSAGVFPVHPHYLRPGVPRRR